MIFIGFGYLMTFLKDYSFTSVGYTFLIGAFIIQYSILTNGLIHNIVNNHHEKILLNINPKFRLFLPNLKNFQF